MAKTPRTIKAPRIIDPEMTVRFLGDWFAPRSRYAVGQGITISNTRNGVSHSRQEIIPASVTQSLTSWQVSLSEDILSFHSAMHGRAFVHPLWTNGSTKLLTENNFGSSITGIPGVWFDMPQIDQKTLDLFMDFLCGTLVDLRPSIITGKPVAAEVIPSSERLYSHVRMWWPYPISDMISLMPEVFMRLAHSRLMQRKLMEFTQSTIGLLLPARPTLHQMAYPLPGIDGCLVLYRNTFAIDMSDTMWLHLGMLKDEHESEFDDVISDLNIPDEEEDLLRVRAQISGMTWDEILVPAGWEVNGMGNDVWTTFWSAPGVPDLVTAYTDQEKLTLHSPHWASGLKEVCDLGVELNRWTVAATLHADGNGVALAQRYATTGRLS